MCQARVKGFCTFEWLLRARSGMREARCYSWHRRSIFRILCHFSIFFRLLPARLQKAQRRRRVRKEQTQKEKEAVFLFKGWLQDGSEAGAGPFSLIELNTGIALFYYTRKLLKAPKCAKGAAADAPEILKSSQKMRRASALGPPNELNWCLTHLISLAPRLSDQMALSSRLWANTICANSERAFVRRKGCND